MHTKRFALFAACLACISTANAQEDVPKKPENAQQPTCPVRGQVKMPGEVPSVINSEGLSLDKVVVTLKGKYKHPRMPYPAEWRSMKPEERREWHNAFMETDDYKNYLQTVEAAKAKREIHRTELAEDGSFTFENIKPAWYELTARIMHPDAKDDRLLELARAHAMTQFIIKNTDKPYRVSLTMKLKNVLTPGDMAPDWTATAYDDSEFKLSDFRGKYVLFDFWATWCGPCLAEFPHLESVFADYEGEDFEMIGLSVDAEVDAPKSLLEKKPSPYRQGWVGELERHKKIADAYGMQSIPSIWLVGPDGRIIARNLSREEIREAVEAVLNPKSETN